jgi:hypothetical protein
MKLCKDIVTFFLPSGRPEMGSLFLNNSAILKYLTHIEKKRKTPKWRHSTSEKWS